MASTNGLASWAGAPLPVSVRGIPRGQRPWFLPGRASRSPATGGGSRPQEVPGVWFGVTSPVVTFLVFWWVPRSPCHPRAFLISAAPGLRVLFLSPVLPDSFIFLSAHRPGGLSRHFDSGFRESFRLVSTCPVVPPPSRRPAQTLFPRTTVLFFLIRRPNPHLSPCFLTSPKNGLFS